MPPIMKKALENKVQKPTESIRPEAAPTGASYASLGFQPVKSKHTSRTAGMRSKCSIVFAKDGKRIEVESEVLDHIGVEDFLQFSVNDQGIAFGKNLPDGDESFPVKERDSKKGKVYSTPLISELIEIFNLDFSNKTTISFQEVVYLDNHGLAVAFVPIQRLSQPETKSEQHEAQPEESNDTSTFAEEADAEEQLEVTEHQQLDQDQDLDE
ncbi:hypothetical protein [Paenibacillus sp. V4I7]|uniref:hypothetical protein n=1 Tax=Paenibacillus sp. V4I7 TaxID=3042307 RepID=UPI002786B9CB|nr:hypothetical protein [Paenibacillus sp. V4I7]MDQ0902768.1 hypothetical protein [Paenibacillus sp. V4I7]